MSPEGPVGTPKPVADNDPKRIKPFVASLGALWALTPDHRFCDVMSDLGRRFKPRAIENASDEEIQNYIVLLIAERSVSDSQDLAE